MIDTVGKTGYRLQEKNRNIIAIWWIFLCKQKLFAWYQRKQMYLARIEILDLLSQCNICYFNSTFLLTDPNIWRSKCNLINGTSKVALRALLNPISPKHNDQLHISHYNHDPRLFKVILASCETSMKKCCLAFWFLPRVKHNIPSQLLIFDFEKRKHALNFPYYVLLKKKITCVIKMCWIFHGK